MDIRIRITSTVHQVYFRAGLPIAPGKSEMAVSPLQCETLEADPRLVVVRLAEDAELSPADPPQAGGDLDATVVGLTGVGHLGEGTTLAIRASRLAEMKVDELRQLAVSLAIDGAASMKKADLVAAITAAEVLNQTEQGAESDTAEGAGEALGQQGEE